MTVKGVLGLVFVLVAFCVTGGACSAQFIACAEDGTCPDSMVCVERRCQELAVGVSCVKGHTTCPGDGSWATETNCVLGVCTRRCGGVPDSFDERTFVACPANEVCSTPQRDVMGRCFKDCTNGESCPAGARCASLGYADKKGCIGAAAALPIDRLCSNNDECNDAIDNATCERGICLTPCFATNRCEDGRVCSRSTGGVCLADCSDGQECPEGLTCQSLGYANTKACARPDQPFGLCRSVRTESWCDGWEFSCPGEQVSCAAGTCPARTTCRKDDGIYGPCSDCPDGYENVTCSGKYCRTFSPTLEDRTGNLICGQKEGWACRRRAPACDSDTSKTAGECTCADGSRIPFSCEAPQKKTCTELCNAKLAP